MPIILVTGKKKSGKSALIQKLQSEMSINLKIDADTITEEKIKSILAEGSKVPLLIECHQEAENLSIDGFMQGLTWYETSGFIGNTLIYETYPFLPF